MPSIPFQIWQLKNAGGSGSGTVTSVAASGGTTGLSFTGSPITTSGTLTLGGTLTYANGGTGNTTAPTNGQLLIGNGSGYTLSTLTAGSGVTITNSAGGISIAATGGGSGTVTSVGLSMPTGFTVTGSPVTTAGTLAVSTTLNGYISGNGTGFTASSTIPTSGLSGTLQAAQFPALTGDVTNTAGTVATTISAGAVTLAKMANLAANSILGNNTAVAATPLALTGAQVTAMLSAFSSTVQGVVPASGGGTTNFLRADGTWAAPAGGGSMVYPGAGIANSTGSAWGTSYSTSGSGTVVPLATSPTVTNLNLAAGTISLAPVVLASGTLLTTAAAGAVEYDGTAFYATPAASTRSVLVSEQLVVLSSTYTLTSQTAAQKLFNATANGAVTLPVGTYEFECAFALSSMSSTSGSFGFALGGTATFSQAWRSLAAKPTGFASTATTPQMTSSTAANATIVTATTGTAGEAFIRGIIRVTVTGTIIPQVSLGVAAAAVVAANSYFRIWPVGSSSVTTVGNWS